MLSGINHVTLAVKNVPISFEFYHQVMGFKPLVRWEGGAYFLVGNFWWCLDRDTTRVPNTCSTHYAFTVSQQDFSHLCSRLVKAGVTIFKENVSPGDSLYFLDPDQHKLEIHVGDWSKRVASKKENIGKWQNVQWYV